jgi:anti-sigma B factor antagonist
MEINTTREADFYLIHLSGDLDASSCILLDKVISEAATGGEKKLLIDCNDLQYISSAGLGVFMSYLQDFETQGISMTLYGLNAKVKKVFQILGLDALINIVNTKEEAKLL